MSREESPLLIKIYESRHLKWTTHFDRQLIVGRQDLNEPPPFRRITTPDGAEKLVVAPTAKNTIGRRQVVLSPCPDDYVEITNGSNTTPVAITPGAEADMAAGANQNVPPGQMQRVKQPFVLHLSDLVVRVEQEVAETGTLQTLSGPPPVPGMQQPVQAPLLRMLRGPAGSTDVLFQWIHATVDVLQHAANSPDFLERAVRATVELLDMDTAAILCEDNGWQQKAVFSRLEDQRWEPSQTILWRVLQEKRTVWQLPETRREGGSLEEVQSLVAAPIMNRSGEIENVLYADRRTPRDGEANDISEVDARLAELLAYSVGAGLARTAREEEALAARIRFGEFFGPDLARRLEEDPGLLSGRDTDVSILFCDIRGFSRISEKLSPERTVAWINDVLTQMSGCVVDREGVLVDYVGDELMAMWGAPAKLDNHPELACQAALAMRARLPQLNERWSRELNTEIDVGIGINTGRARTGNTGSQLKFKYGALGHTVNLASRVQGATKYLRTQILITGSTAEQLQGRYPLRRLCQVAVVNITKPVELFELVAEPTDTWRRLKDGYEEALAQFEAGNQREAIHLLGGLINEFPHDGPSFLLLSRAVDAVAHEETEFDPVWKLSGK